MKSTPIQLYRNIDELLTLAPAAEKKGRGCVEADLGIAQRQAMAVQDGKFLWVGSQKKIPKFGRSKVQEINLQGQTVLPGWVECHTHSLFVGQRASEFERRLQGVSYQQIAKEGGGILKSVRELRGASPKVLQAQLQKNIQRFSSQGVTTLEIKTGYGLDLASESKCLKILSAVSKNKKTAHPHVVRTFLGAHAVPPEFSNEQAYLQSLSDELLPVIAKKKWADRVDIFIEKGFFSVEIARSYLAKAKSLGLALTIHADQLSLSGGTDLAVEMGALSADHVIQLGPQQIRNLAKSETTAVLLPAADLYMRCAYPPARALLDAGARVALSTDFNPGTSPTQSLGLVGLLARLEMKMSLPEVIVGFTVGAAHALGRSDIAGTIEPGKPADFFSIDKNWQELFYSGAPDLATQVFVDGLSVRLY